MFKRLLLSLALLSMPGISHAADHLLFFEAQGIAGYSTAIDKAVYYSMNPDAEMQKPSVGFDFLKRFSGEYGDVATFALQGRLAVKDDGEATTLEPQVYNAYIKAKTPVGYAWLGHNRPALGLSSYFDSHGLILRTLAIQGFGYDRDWGAGLYKDFSWGDFSASVTTGTGMPVYFKGNVMGAARVSYGVLSQDNYNVGLSCGFGSTLDTMGYKLRDPDDLKMSLVGGDATVLMDNIENRFDVLAGEWLGESTVAVFYRLGLNLDPEGRFKVEAQPTYWNAGEEEDFQGSLCLTSQVTSDLTVRASYTYDRLTDDNRVIFQLYYYKPL